MKIITFAFIAVAALGCSKNKKPATTTTSSQPAPAAAKQADDKLMAAVTGDQKVSDTLALSGDIIQRCGIKASASANPTFDYDKEDLSDEDKKVLDQLATCLMTGALKGQSVALIGRADPRGTEEYNLGLGSRRASSVSSYLTRLGVGAPQLAVTTRGALDATGTDEAGWQKDRRVDITLAQ